jgi:lipoprotein signal peptidase
MGRFLVWALRSARYESLRSRNIAWRSPERRLSYAVALLLAKSGLRTSIGRLARSLPRTRVARCVAPRLRRLHADLEPMDRTLNRPPEPWLNAALRSAREHGTLRLATLLGTAAFLFDWATKSWALRYLDATSFPLGSLTLRVARNQAFAFSSHAGEVTTALVLGVRVGMLVGIVLLCRRLATLLSRRTACGAALLMAGGLGNSVDLLFRGGAVVDFIGAGPFAVFWGGELMLVHLVFNAADLFILIGIALLAPLISHAGHALQRRIAAWERGVLPGPGVTSGERHPGAD